MKFLETELKEAYIIKMEPVEDERGFFARSFCKKEFEKHGLNFSIAQCNISYNKDRRILRGMHYQRKPHEEAKLVGCIKGAIYDVIIDMRRNSPTYCKWVSVELTDKDYKMLYIPKGFAHGFQTLEDRTMVFYHMSEFYNPGSEMGIRWNDPFFAIKWPDARNMKISNKDRSYPDYQRKGR